MNIRKPHFLSLAAMARRLDLPQQRLSALIKEGRIKPDATSGRVSLFDLAQIETLAGKIRGARILFPR